MKLSPSLRARTLCFTAAQAAFALLPCAVFAQTPQVRQTPASTRGTQGQFISTAPRFSMDLKATPLRQALVSLFTNAKTEYILDEDVPDTPITLTIRDQDLSAAVQQLLQRGGGDKNLIYTVGEGRVYRISTVPPTTEPLRTSSIHLSSVRASDVMGQLQTAFPTSLILPSGDASSLLVRGSAQQNQDVRELASLLDTAPKTVVLRAEVVMVSDGGSAKPGSKGRSTILSTNLKTLSGQETTGDEKLMGSPAQTAKLQLTATPFLLGDSTFQVDTRWDVSLPLPTGKTSANGEKGAGLVRLEKRLTTTTRLKNGETTLVGGVVLSQYGLKGEVLFFVTLNVVGP